MNKLLKLFLLQIAALVITLFFTPAKSASAQPGYYGPPPSTTITCSSNDGKRNWCNIGPSRDVRLVNQRSGSPCVRGSTWGVDNRGLWVDRGCRADFAIIAGGGHGPGPQPSGGVITCSSNDGNRNWCSIGRSRDARLVNQRSGSPCVRGKHLGSR